MSRVPRDELAMLRTSRLIGTSDAFKVGARRAAAKATMDQLAIDNSRMKAYNSDRNHLEEKRPKQCLAPLSARRGKKSSRNAAASARCRRKYGTDVVAAFRALLSRLYFSNKSNDSDRGSGSKMANLIRALVNFERRRNI